MSLPIDIILSDLKARNEEMFQKKEKANVSSLTEIKPFN